MQLNEALTVQAAYVVLDDGCEHLLQVLVAVCELRYARSHVIHFREERACLSLHLFNGGLGGGGRGGGEILCSKDWLCKKHNHVGVE